MGAHLETGTPGWRPKASMPSPTTATSSVIAPPPAGTRRHGLLPPGGRDRAELHRHPDAEPGGSDSSAAPRRELHRATRRTPRRTARTSPSRLRCTAATSAGALDRPTPKRPATREAHVHGHRSTYNGACALARERDRSALTAFRAEQHGRRCRAAIRSGATNTVSRCSSMAQAFVRPAVPAAAARRSVRRHAHHRQRQVVRWSPTRVSPTMPFGDTSARCCCTGRAPHG